MAIYLTILLISVNTILSSLIIRDLYPAHLSKYSLFFFDLIGSPLYLPRSAIFLFGIVNIVLLIIIGKNIVKKYCFIPAFIYSISPWSFYLTAFGSFYIYLLSLILLMTYGLVLVRSNNRLGTLIFIGTNIAFLYSSVFAFLLLPIPILVIRNKTKFLIFLVVFCLPILFFSIKNFSAIRNIYSNQVNIFSNPGLINSVNIFQGQAQKANLRILGRVSENKYIYYTKFVTFKFIKNITPSTFFTSQEKLFDFSFSPPIFVGFLIPYFFGLYYLIKSAKTFKYLLLSLTLTIPSILSEKMVDLNRLVIFSPVIFFMTTLGIIKILEKKNRIFRLLLFLSLLIVVIQYLITISDISLREYLRFERNFGTNFEITYR